MKLEKGLLFNERYLLVEALGIGASAEVWLAKDTKTGIEVALKIYAPSMGLDDAGLDVFAREFGLVVNADHRNLLKPLYYDTCGRIPYLVLPYCKNGNITKLVGRFSEQDAWRLLHDVASGLAWLHSMKPPVVHQDIKPDNIMIGDNGDFRITDFGVSTRLRSTLRKSMSSAFRSAGTIAYMAPERFGKDNTPVKASDIYSLGATVFEMLTGDAPFGDNGGLVQKGGAEVPYIRGNYSEQLKKVVDKCLKLNPWDRPTAEQLERYAIAGMEGRTIDFVDEYPHCNFESRPKVENRPTVEMQPVEENSSRRKKYYGYVIGALVVAAVVCAFIGFNDKDNGNADEYVAVVDSIGDSLAEEPATEAYVEEQVPIAETAAEQPDAAIVEKEPEVTYRQEKTDKKADKQPEKRQIEEQNSSDAEEMRHYESVRIREKEPVREQVFKAVEQMPQFQGGDAALMKYISNNIRYPAIAMENNVQGRVIVQFVVTKTGDIGDVKVVRSVDPSLDREAVRICKSLPKFIPGRMNGEPVNVWYVVSVNFRL